MIKMYTLFTDISSYANSRMQSVTVIKVRRLAIKRPQKDTGRQVTLETQINCNSEGVSQ